MSTHILVVDDEKELADVLELYLTNDGYTVHKCYTGAESLDCIEHTDLDLALLDVMLPDVDGFQLCKKIREKSYCPTSLSGMRPVGQFAALRSCFRHTHKTSPLFVCFRVKIEPHFPQVIFLDNGYSFRVVEIRCPLFSSELGLSQRHHAL